MLKAIANTLKKWFGPEPRRVEKYQVGIVKAQFETELNDPRVFTLEFRGIAEAMGIQDFVYKYTADKQFDDYLAQATRQGFHRVNKTLLVPVGKVNLLRKENLPFEVEISF